jgi:hypothetical protein
MACTLKVELLSQSSPTAAGGWGEVVYRLSGAADAYQLVQVRRVSDDLLVNANQPAGNGDYTLPIPTSGIGVELVLTAYEEAVYDDTTCQDKVVFTIPGYADLVDPSLADAPRWEPVGGVLPNPVLLKVEASLLTAGVARVGLHVEVELIEDGKAFASFRATMRTATQYVDAAPYLRAQLVALQRYDATANAPHIDPDAVLRFSYRYRVVDRTGAEPWQTRARERYAVLAALPLANDTMAPYVADTTGKVASVFPDREGCQFVGLPLEASVLLPPFIGTPRWAELRYLDAYSNPVEIRSYALDVGLAAGMLRIPLPNDPPLCAAFVEVSVRDDNRAYVGSCGHVIPTPPASTRGTYQDPIIGFY